MTVGSCGFVWGRYVIDNLPHFRMAGPSEETTMSRDMYFVDMAFNVVQCDHAWADITFDLRAARSD